MVFKEVQHIWLEIAEELPVSCYSCCRLPEFYRHPVVIHILFNHCTQGIIKT